MLHHSTDAQHLPSGFTPVSSGTRVVAGPLESLVVTLSTTVCREYAVATPLYL